tara:strand:+ start:1034 stop:1255 length:222 start_codon:yes stop_codon:yes gene_type:complete
MIDASIYLSYGVAGVIITTVISLLCHFNKKTIIKKLCKEKEIVLQPGGIVLTTPVKLVLEVNNNDIEQWSIVN